MELYFCPSPPPPHTFLAYTGTTLPLAHDFSVYCMEPQGFYEIWLPFASRLKLWQVWFYGLVVRYNLSAFQLFVMFREPISRACNLLSDSIYNLIIICFWTSCIAVSKSQGYTSPSVTSRVITREESPRLNCCSRSHQRQLIAHPANISHQPTHWHTRTLDETTISHRRTGNHYVCKYHLIHWWLHDKRVAFYKECKITCWESLLCVI